MRRAAKATLVVVVVAFLWLRASAATESLSAENWDWSLDLLLALLAIVFQLLALLVVSANWKFLLNANGVRLSTLSAMSVFLASHFSRYIPGQFWMYGSRLVLGSRAGVHLTIGMRVLFQEAILGVVAALATSVVAMSQLPDGTAGHWSLRAGAVLLLLLALHPVVYRALVRVGARLVKIIDQDVSFRYREMLLSLVLLGIGWFLSGASLYFLVKAHDPAASIGLKGAAGIYATSWLVGYLTFLTPAGVGVREATLAALLSAWIPLTAAIAVALLARLVTIAAELLGYLFVRVIMLTKSRSQGAILGS